VWTVGKVVRVPLLVLAGYAGVLGFTYWGYLQLPTGFIPTQDKGYLIASIQLPDAASAGRTREVMDAITKIALAEPGVAHVNAVAGNSFVLSAYGSNFGSMFIILDGFDKRRHDKTLYSDAIAARLRAKIGRQISGADVQIFGAPAVPRLGRAGGFRLMIEDRGDIPAEVLQGQTENLIEKGNQQPGLVGLRTVFRTTSPQLFVKVNPAACSAQGVEVRDVYAVMQASLGARYVNDFNLLGRTWQVNVQADPRFRNEPGDITRLRVKNKAGQLVPLGAVAEVREVTGPLVYSRYNMYPAAAINGSVAPGVSSGDAVAVLEALAKRELPGNMAFEWTELTFIEQRSRSTGMYVFGLSVFVVFLVLAALYESWALPLAVILVVPMCVACSLLWVWVTTWDHVTAADFLIDPAKWWVGPLLHLEPGKYAVNPATWLGVLHPDVKYGVNVADAVGISKQDVNIFTQVGFVVLIGLACKNSILIVEYAKAKREAGADARTAILDACRLRLRPILMTSFAFVLGVTPMVFATGAGAEMRQALGLAVFGGMLGVTAFGIFLTPAFFVLVDRLAGGVRVRFPWLGRAGAFAAGVLSMRWVPEIIKRGRG
jgi:multidrug efflux pump